MEDESRSAFLKWLLTEKTGRQSCMIGRPQGEMIIRYLREKRERGEDDPVLRSNFDAVFRASVKKRNFKLLNAVGLGDILCLPVKKTANKGRENHAMLGQNRQVIFKEDMYDVIQNAHKNGSKHRGYKGTFNKINETYCSIPREVVYKYVELCEFCAVHHACYTPKHHRESNGKTTSGKKVKKQKKKIEFSDAFLTRCQIDIIDMTKNADGAFSYIGHFFDHHTKYNVLFPLKTREPVYVAKKLCRHVFGHFGLPRIIYSNMTREYIDDLTHWIIHFWSTDVPIINGDPDNKKLLPLIQQRQKTVMILIETIRSKQDSLNTNEFEQEFPPSFDAVFKSRPRCYSYSASNTQTPREEDLAESEEDVVNDDVAVIGMGDASQEFICQPSVATPSSEDSSPNFSLSAPGSLIPLTMVSGKKDISHLDLLDNSDTAHDVSCNVSLENESKSLGILSVPANDVQE
eukprot:gene14248-5274_t